MQLCVGMRPQERFDLKILKDVYDQLLQKERHHQEECVEYNRKITEKQNDLFNRIREEKERSTLLTAAFMEQHQRTMEGMYALMTRMQAAVLSDRDCAPLTQLQTRLFTLGNEQLEAFNAFGVLTTNDKKTREHIKRKALAKKLAEQCEEVRGTIRSLESSLAVNTTIDGSIKADLQESAVRIELALQSFLKVFGKLRLVLNRGEEMHDHHVDAITDAFDRMQQAIVSMPPLSCVSALEVIETGLQQLALEDTRGQQALANGSCLMIDNQ